MRGKVKSAGYGRVRGRAQRADERRLRKTARVKMTEDVVGNVATYVMTEGVAM